MTIARVYEYGLLPPTLNEELVIQQMRGTHRYKNKLTEIEHQRRVQVQRVMTKHDTVQPLQARVDDLVRQMEEARTAVRATNAKARARVEQAETKARIRELAVALRKQRVLLREAKAEIRKDPAITEGLARVEDESRARVREERKLCDVYWGSYLLAEAAADQARKSMTPPKFQPWTGNGRVAVQIQGGMALDEIWGGDSRFVIDPVNPAAYEPETPRGQRRRMSRTMLRMRISSTEKGKPVWGEWPMIMHRPLPAGCRIKHATVHRRRRDCRTWAWTVTIQVELPDTWTRGKPGTGAVALNLGFCQSYPHLQGAIRSGFLVDEDGDSREITVRRSVMDRVEKAESIRSYRDKNLDTMRDELVLWMRANESLLPDWFVERTILSRPRRSDTAQPAGASSAGHDLHHQNPPADVHAGRADIAFPDQPAGLQAGRKSAGQLPDAAGQMADEQGPLGALQAETLSEHTPETYTPAGSRTRVWHVSQWRSAQRYRELCFAWRKQRWPGDEAGHAILEAWRYRDEHLERYETNMARHALGDRRESYRIVAAELARRYETLVLHDTDLRELQKSPAPESNRTEIPAVKRNQRFAAGSVLRSTLENAFRRCGGTVIVVDDEGITKTCHQCKKTCVWDRATLRTHTCEHCGAQWDQDENACKNMIDRYRVDRLKAPGWDDDGTPIEKKESRSERLRRARRKKPVDDAASNLSPASL